jgi:hypothetical protein
METRYSSLLLVGKRSDRVAIRHLKYHLRTSALFKYFSSQGEQEQKLSCADIVSGAV